MKKRVVALVLALALTMGLTSGLVLADDGETSGTCGENLIWVLEDGVLTISGTGEMDDCTNEYGSPDDAPWEDVKEEITSVVIESGVTSIGDCAFYVCSGLESVSLPSTLTSIGDCAFQCCFNLTDIEIPEGVTTIGDCAFMQCSSLESIVIPEGVTYLGSEAFGFCFNLVYVSLPSTLEHIESSTFNLCYSIENIEIPEGVTSIGWGAFAREYMTGEISDDPTSLTSISLPSTLTSISKYAFYSCGNLTDIYYAGTEEQWNEISIEEYNDPLLNATIHYSSVSDSVDSDDTGSSSDVSDTSLSIIDSETAASYTLGSGGSAVIAVDADIADFVSVTVDGVVLTQDTDYTVTEGSTIVTFLESFLETLSEGEHDVVIAFIGGDVETTLIIAAADTSSDSDDSDAAEVGDSSGFAAWMALAFLATLGLAGAGIRKKIAG